MITLPDAAAGAVLAATIAGLISLIGLVIAKEQKISDFRQQWIDGLRTDVAGLIAHCAAIYSHLVTGAGSLDKQWSVAKDDYFSANQKLSMILLRLNPKEEISQQVIVHARALQGAFMTGFAPPPSKMVEMQEGLVEATRQLLKAEWHRVREGERIYGVARRTALVSTISGAAVLLIGMARWFVSVQ